MNEHPDNAETAQAEDAPEEKGLSTLQLAHSAIMAAIGVQSSENRKRDFSRGKPGQFIVIGIVFTALFVLVIVGVVNLVLSSGT